MAPTTPRSIAQLIKEAETFEYSDFIRLRSWLRTARQIRQQAEIYEAEGNLQQAFLLYYRQASLVFDHLQKHPEVKVSPADRTLLRAAKKDVEISLDRAEQLKPLVKDQYDRYARRLEELVRKQTVAATGASAPDTFSASAATAARSRDSRPRSSTTYSIGSPYPSRPSSSASYDEAGHQVYYEGHRHPELALRVAQQAQGQLRSSIPPSLRVRSSKERDDDDDDDFVLSQGLQNIRLQLDGKTKGNGGRGAISAQQQPISREPRKTPYPSVPSSHDIPAALRPGDDSEPWSPYKVLQPQVPGVPRKVPIKADLQAPLRPPKEDPALERLSSNRALGPSLPPKFPSDRVSAVVETPKIFKAAAYLENSVPLRTVFFPPALRQDFLKLAAANTKKKVETCGILCGFLKNNALFVSAVVIPDQISTSDTCEVTEEGDVALFDWVDSHDLLTLGWIHTHPTQTCFMSSRDLHTHCGYQSMISESIAVVCAPSLRTKNGDTEYGIYRLTDPPGMPCVRNCTDSRVFHPHNVDNLYTDCQRPGHVVELAGLAYQVHDLRGKT